ncbi:MAG: tryptophan--tRNA ligase [Fidelibacterota bacterium]
MKGKRVLSGIQPSGHLHLGNYFGMMKRMIQYQENNELFAFLVTYHALTTVTDGDLLKKNTLEAACDFIALGLDPDKSVFWVQSDVPEVTELTWLLSNVTNVGMLERAHSYKDKIAKGATPNHGLFSYPVLMAADILLFGGEIVPVGKDQKQHLEISRDIAIRFNATYGETFVVPEPLIEGDSSLIPGTDGQKMSKSYRNTIEIFSDKDELAREVMGIVTDATPVERPKDPDASTLFRIFSLFLDESGARDLRQKFTAPGLRYSEVKADLVDVIWDFFEPYREKRRALAGDKGYVVNVLRTGAEKARGVAVSFLSKARKSVGLNYWD